MVPQFNIHSLRQSFLNVSGLFMIGMSLLFLTNVVLARTLSVSEFGTFSFVISLATVLAVPVTGGLPMLLTREVAALSQEGQWAACRGVIGWSYGLILKTSAVFLFILMLWFALANERATTIIIAVAVLVPILGLNGVRNGVLKGLGRPGLAEMPTQLLQPIAMIAGYLFLYSSGQASTKNALVWYVIACGIVFAIASFLQWRAQPQALVQVKANRAKKGRWRRSILPLTLVSAASVIFAQLALLILGFAEHEEHVAIFRVAERGAMLVALPMIFIDTVLGPYFVKATRSEGTQELSQIVRHSTRLTSALSLAIAAVLILFGQPLLAFAFGSPYDVQSYWPMAILIAGQLISVSMGSAGYLLAVTGHERLALVSSLAGILILGGAGLLLIPHFAVLGAAIAASLAIVCSKFIAALFCWKVNGVRTALV